MLCIDGGLIFGLNRFYSPAGETVVVITACLFLALPKVADRYIVIAIRTLHMYGLQGSSDIWMYSCICTVLNTRPGRDGR